VGFAVFGKMIWNEYRDISEKDCGVFSGNTHAKIQKVTKLSAVAIVVAFCTVGILVWTFGVSVWNINNVIAFIVVGRGIEVTWITSMLLVLSPSLQTWGAGNSSNKMATHGATSFDGLSDDCDSSSSEGDDVEAGAGVNKKDNSTVSSPTPGAGIGTVGVQSTTVNDVNNDQEQNNDNNDNINNNNSSSQHGDMQA
ncbi:hypothetical protein SAMD00019534_023690, partial [Acytostelium subglobosum LB1]|uniref:hypothetical protein n=1 Tax=Acytostelium subglobosum LB1 TaxID=1410327 RepID=UPI0006451DB6